MKKVLFSISLMVMGLFFVACTNSAPKAEGEAAAKEGTEVKEEVMNLDEIKALVESATKDGANWTEAQWKDAFIKVMKAAKPMLVELKEVQKKIESAGDDDKLKVVSELTEKLEKYKDVSEQFDAFNKAAESTEIGKKLNNDENFQKEVEKELGVEGLFDNL